MRQFTKTHNDLSWLFPTPDKYSQGDDSWHERYFDKYEEYGPYLMRMCYGEKKQTFDRDDMMDAFMKGASEGHHTLTAEVDRIMSHPENVIDFEKIKNEYETANALVNCGYTEDAIRLYKLTIESILVMMHGRIRSTE